MDHIKLLGVVTTSHDGIPEKKVHYQNGDGYHVVKITGDNKRLSAGEVCEVVAGKEKVKVDSVIMRRTLKHSLNKHAKHGRKESE